MPAAKSLAFRTKSVFLDASRSASHWGIIATTRSDQWVMPPATAACPDGSVKLVGALPT
jgi:hypothetical protein